MATGDISAVSIHSSGYYATITVTGFTTGATYSVGTTPSNYKCVFTVTSKGFDSTGSATTVARTVYGHFIRYKENPPANSYAKDETTSGSDLVFTIALSDPIYQKDNTGAGNSGTAVTVTIAAGLVTNTGGGAQTSNALSGFTVTNNSTLAYPKAVARWLTLPYKRIPSGNFSVDVMAFAMFGIAAVKFTLADGTVTRTSTVTAMGISGDSGYPAYYVTDACSNFTQSANITCRAQVYPVVGDTTEVRDSNDYSFAGALEFATLPVGVCDKGGTWGFAYCAVNASTGNDTTGVASSSQATAEASPVATISKALKKIQDYHNSNYSRNNPGGGVILLQGSSHLYGVGGETINTFATANVTITRSSTDTRASAKITGYNATSRYGPAHVRLYDISIVSSSTANQQIGWFSANGDTAVVENVTVTGSGGSTKMWSGNTGKGHCWWKNVNITGYTLGLQAGNDQCSPLALGCVCNYTSATKVWSQVMCVVGCSSIGAGTTEVYGYGNASWTNTGNIILAYNRAYACTSQAIDNTKNEQVNDIFVVGNVFERIGTDPSSVIECSDATMDNVHFWHNTLAGDRANIEPDIVTPLVDKTTTNMTCRNNSWRRFATLNHGDDTAMTMVGHRAFQYGVGHRHNNEEDDSLGLANFYGGWDWVVGASSYTLDGSKVGTNFGMGDYTPTASSALLGRLTSASDIIVPYLWRPDWTFGAITAGANAPIGAMTRIPAATSSGIVGYAHA